MIEAMRWTAANYTRANAVSYGFQMAAGSAATFLGRLYEAVPAILPPMAVALAGWAWWRSRGSAAFPKSALPLLAAGLALTLSAWPRWSSLQLIFVSAIPFTLCGIFLNRAFGSRWRPCFYAAMLVCAGVSGAFKAAGAYTNQEFVTRAGFMSGSSEDVEFLEPFERRISTGDTLFVFPYLPALYTLLDARNPTRYSFLQPGMMTAEDERRAIAELDAGRPRWVVLADILPQTVLAFWPGSDPARIPMRAMHEYIQAHYRQVEQVNGKWGAMSILERSAVPQ